MAIIATVMLLITAGMIEFSRAFWYRNALDKATRDAARFMSMVASTDMKDATQLASAISTAKTIALTTANGANVQPALTTNNIDIKCDAAACSGTAPTYITVSIVNFSVRIGQLFPFFSHSGGTFGDIPLNPGTTMRYMN
ncbi:pilus assembly protein [Noviherbaspirillum sp. DKR-6]|uniref:Pilus assembly protein n=2 Tax=Noviherbaspirillum pedocola TaxID=2801341 RepID=A0A934SVZ8_9BURK|nr:pilus assembly protein [Noviherbaspirillum pedocola]